MKIKTNRNYSLTELTNVLANQFPNYKVSVEKNPLMGFEYGIVQKSGLLAAIVRVKNDQVQVYAGIPSTMIRFLFFLLVILLGVIIPLIIYMLISGKIVNEVGSYLSSAILSGQDLSTLSAQNFNSGNSIIDIQGTDVQNVPMPQVVKWASIAGIAITGYFILRTLINVPLYYLSENYLLIPLLMNIFAAIGLILTLTGKKAGFYLFTAAIALKLIIPFALYGGLGIFGIGYLYLLIDLAIIVILAVNLKYLK